MRSSTVCLSSLVGCVVATLLLAFGAGCAGHNTTDRCWVRPDKHEQAQRLYERTGSLELTATALREDGEWTDCQINETVARLEKENSI